MDKKFIADIPMFIEEWDYEKNSELDIQPQNITSGSNKKVWWKCKRCGYSWYQSPNVRTNKNTKCPSCNGKILIPGVNDLASVNPKLAEEWDYEKNSSLTPSMVKPYSNKKVWWKCSKNHSWQSTVANRSYGNKCPICNRESLVTERIQKCIKENGSLKERFPELISEWDFSKNELTPNEVTAYSNKKVWWKCSKGHSYNMRISHRVEGHSCPYCAGQKILVGVNDFETWCKKNNKEFLLNEWDMTSTSLSPKEVSRFSRKRIRWKCRICGHQWEASIYSRSSNIMCPHCANRSKTSFPEQAILFYILKIFPDAVSRYSNKDANITELDIFIPSLSIGIEYDGRVWHSSPNAYKKEVEKYKSCKKAKIKIIRVRETGLQRNENTYDWIVESSYKTLESNCKEIDECINQILHIVCPNQKLLVNTQKDRDAIMELYYCNLLSGSLQELYPDIASEWDYDMNGNITPAMVPAYSNEKFFFKCSKGHTYETVVSKRTIRSDGCPYCSGRKVLLGYNDLFTTHPQIAAEWDYEKNGTLYPKDISKGYDKKVWWKCSQGHSFYTSPNTRTSQNVGCPICKGGVRKEVNSYTLEGKFLKHFQSLSDAAKEYGVSNSAISKSCKQKTPCVKLQFRYSDTKDAKSIPPFIQKTINNKPVNQFDLNGKFIASYESATVAFNQTGAKKISEVCHRRRKSSGGYIWRFKDDCTDMC